jgi:1-deoxy-D-xylulose-5-phosphate reductoisomerase
MPAPADTTARAASRTTDPARPRRVIVLGSTGSIGTQTLDVIAHLNALHARGQWPVSFQVVALSAGRNAALLAQQALDHRVPIVALNDQSQAEVLRNAHTAAHASAKPHAPLQVLTGPDSAEQLVRTIDCDLVVAAMVGIAGLPATLAAVQLGRDVALANKETLVAAGALVVPAARASGSRLLPVDSEHSALWQSLQGRARDESGMPCPPSPVGPEVARVVLTASGGPFRTWTRDALMNATLSQALKHPTWTMGAKVTIDSASLTNKGFEVIEAHWLFDLPRSRIGVLIHPQSIVHSFVEFADAGVIAQLATPDMRGPIQYALTFPLRAPARARALDWATLRSLDFEPVDPEKFPALESAFRVIDRGGASGAVFNAASEAATEAFIAAGDSGAIRFGRVSALACEALEALTARSTPPANTLSDVLDADREARAFVRARLGAAPASAPVSVPVAAPATAAAPAVP